MVFNSLVFLLFFGVVLLVHMSSLSWRAKKLNLLIASYLFYGAWNPPFVSLIVISTLVDWFATRRMSRTESAHVRKLLLLTSMIANLGLLGFFKYSGFLLDSFVAGLHLVGIEFRAAAPDIILPVGISFYTFQTMSYTIDVYRGRAKPWHSFLDFALYVTFFPQLVAGPIVRSEHFLPQCVESRRATGAQLGWGFTLLLVGLFHKVAIADALLGPVADKVYQAGLHPGFYEAWSGTFAFAGQIFCDFFGYSTCAIGVAMCVGFWLPENFRWPYGAIGFSDFWRRWHISLSSWLRDYLYISLGGNRNGPRRTQINLMTTMLLGGLWHGAAWTFVVWGGLHGAYLIAERWVKRWTEPHAWARTLPVLVLGALFTYFLVCITWVFFRAHEFDTAFSMLGTMLGLHSVPGAGILAQGEMLSVLVITALMLAAHWKLRNSSLEDVASRLSWPTRAIVLAFLILLTLTSAGDDRAFIYFQF